MYAILLDMYKSGKLTEEGLDNAVAKGWISEEQKNMIRDN